MKYIAINTGDGCIVLPAANCGPIVQALENAVCYQKNWGGKYILLKDDCHSPRLPVVEFIDQAALDAVPEPVQELTKDLGKAKTDWLHEYQKRIKAETALATLKHDLAARGITIEDETKEAS